MEQATVTTLTATKEARSMRKKHSGNIFRYGKDLLSKNSYTGSRGPGLREWEKSLGANVLQKVLGNWQLAIIRQKGHYGEISNA